MAQKFWLRLLAALVAPLSTWAAQVIHVPSSQAVVLTVKSDEVYELASPKGYLLDSEFPQPDGRSRYYFANKDDRSRLLFIYVLKATQTDEPEKFFRADHLRAGKAVTSYEAKLFSNKPVDGAIGSGRMTTQAGHEEHFRIFRISEGWLSVGMRKTSTFTQEDVRMQEAFSRSLRRSQMLLFPAK